MRALGPVVGSQVLQVKGLKACLGIDMNCIDSWYLFVPFVHVDCRRMHALSACLWYPQMRTFVFVSSSLAFRILR